MSNDLENAPAALEEEADEAPVSEAPDAGDNPELGDTAESEASEVEVADASDVETPEADTAASEASEVEVADASDVETPEADTAASEASEVEVADAADVETPESAENASDEVVEKKVTVREALVAPDLSDLPDDIGDDFERAIEATVLEFKERDIVVGTVVSVDAEGAMVDIGYKSEGLIPVRELSIRNNVAPSDTVQIGERVEAVVLNKEDDEGRLILSKKRAMYERAWGEIEQIAQEEGPVGGHCDRGCQRRVDR